MSVCPPSPKYLFRKMELNDIFQVLKKLTYQDYFRLMSSCRGIYDLVHEICGYEKVLPPSVSLELVESRSGLSPAKVKFLWKDTDENGDFDRPYERNCQDLQTVLPGDYYGLRFRYLRIDPDNQSRFSNSKQLVEFIAESKITCETLQAKEVGDDGDMEELFKMLKPNRLVLECRHTGGWQMLMESKVKLSYIQLYLPLAASLQLLPNLLGSVPSIVIRYAISLEEHAQVYNLSVQDLLSHLSATFTKVMQLPARQCRYLKISYSVRKMDQYVTVPTREQIYPLFWKYRQIGDYEGESSCYSTKFTVKREEEGYSTEVTVAASSKLKEDFSFELKHNFSTGVVGQ